MTKNINTTMQNEKDADFNQPSEIYQIFLKEQTLYFTDFNQDLDFFDENGNPQIYKSVAISRSKASKSNDTKVDSITVNIDNVNLEMSAYEAASEISGQRMVILKIFKNQLDNPDNKIYVFSGEMDAPAIDQHAMAVEVVSDLDTLNVQLPRRNFQVKCSWPEGFAGSGCGIDTNHYTQTGTIDSISSDGLTITDADRTESDDYWKYGTFIVGTEKQRIISNSNGNINLQFLLDAQAGDQYTIKAGCSKIRDDGQNGCARYNNQQNYGGFISIPRTRDPRTESY
jgi:hypothetical protein